MRVLKSNSGQMTLEYLVMFVVIVAVVLYAGVNLIKPSVNRFFVGTANVINETASQIRNSF